MVEFDPNKMSDSGDWMAAQQRLTQISLRNKDEVTLLAVEKNISMKYGSLIALRFLLDEWKSFNNNAETSS